MNAPVKAELESFRDYMIPGRARLSFASPSLFVRALQQCDVGIMQLLM